MREMKDSGVAWIGEIPKNWAIFKMKQLGTYTNGYAFKPEDWKNTGLPIIRIQDLTGSYSNPNYYDGEIDEKYRVKNGDILVSWAATLNAFVWNKGDGWLNQHIFKAEHNAYTVFKYYFWLLKTAMVYMNDDNKHGIMMQHVTLPIFNNFRVPLPTLEEQQKIASLLDKKCTQIDTLISNQQQQIEKLKAYKQSLITEVVTKGLNPDVPMKDSGVEWIGEIPESWEVVKTGRLFKENNRKPYGNDTPLSLSQVDGLIATDDMKESSLKTSTYENWKRVEIGDLVLNRFKAHLGVLFAATLTGIVSFHYGVYEARTQIIPKYYEYLYHSEQYKAILGNASNGMVVGLQNLSNLNFYSTYSLFPTFDEQKQIVEHLDKKCSEIDSLIAIKQQKIEKLQQYKKSVIYEYVTGKKGVE